MLVERNEPAYTAQINPESANNKPNLQEMSIRLEGCRRLAEDEVEVEETTPREMNGTTFSDDSDATRTTAREGKGVKLGGVTSVVLVSLIIIAVIIVVALSVGLSLAPERNRGDMEGGVSSTFPDDTEEPYTLTLHDIIKKCKAGDRLSPSDFSPQAQARREAIFREYNTDIGANDCTQPEYLAAAALALSRTPTTDARFALALFFVSLSGHTWSRSDDWVTGESECSWYGITCNSYGDVVTIHLEDNMLQNELPPLGRLSNLTSLRLSLNDIQGTLPLENDMPSLEVLDLRFNSINDSIERIVESLPNIKNLDLSENNLYGPLSAIQKLPYTLESLNLAGNHYLYGKLERDLFLFPSLRKLDLGYLPSLKGTIPEDMFKSLYSLQYLNVELTSVEGILPEGIWELPSLEKLYIGSSLLSGTIPPSAFVFNPNWKCIDMRNTLVSGTLPTTIGHLKELRELIAMDSKIKGPIPTTIGECTSLQAMDLRASFLSSTIPSELGLLTNLRLLSLMHNFLTGTIPSELGQIQSLEELSLTQSSRLTGTIPSELCNITGLQVLTVSCYMAGYLTCPCCTGCNVPTTASPGGS